MNPIIYTVIGLRAAALGLDLAGRATAASSLYAVADLVAAGKATDEHMALIAEKLKTREVTMSDWDDVLVRIQSDSDRLQAGDTPTG